MATRRRACSELSRRRGASGRDAMPASLPEPIPSAPSVAGEAQGRGYSARRIGAHRAPGAARRKRIVPLLQRRTSRLVPFACSAHCHLLQQLLRRTAVHLSTAARARAPDETVASFQARCRPARIHRSCTSTSPVPGRPVGCPRTRKSLLAETALIPVAGDVAIIPVRFHGISLRSRHLRSPLKLNRSWSRRPSHACARLRKTFPEALRWKTFPRPSGQP